jgi:predicted alpha/beta hydrolase family esterase
MDDRVFLILHGWGGNKPEHWQEHLYTQLTQAGALVHYPQMPTPETPELSAWLACLRRELGIIARHYSELPLTVLAHSLGCISWMHLVGGIAAAPDHLADRVLLVAPPYILPQAPPPDAPETINQFFPPPLYQSAMHTVARETVLIASDNDDYATWDQSCGYAAALNEPIHCLKGAGHISPYYGYGEWPWVFDWCVGKADFPPQPNK